MGKTFDRNHIKLCVDYCLGACVAHPYKSLLGKRGTSLDSLGINSGSGFFQILGHAIGMELSKEFFIQRQGLSIPRLIDEITKEYCAQKQAAQESLSKQKILEEYNNIPPMILKKIKEIIFTKS